MKGLHSFGHQHGFTSAWSNRRRGLNWLASIAATKSIMAADDDDEFTADCTCFPNTRHTLAHFECHSSHRGLAFGVASPAPGASTLGVDNYPSPDEVDCQRKMTRGKNTTHVSMILFTAHYWVFIVWLLCKWQYNPVLGQYPLFLSPNHCHFRWLIAHITHCLENTPKFSLTGELPIKN